MGYTDLNRSTMECIRRKVPRIVLIAVSYYLAGRLALLLPDRQKVLSAR